MSQGYSKKAVDKELDKSGVKGAKRKAYHAILKGRQKSDEPETKNEEREDEMAKKKIEETAASDTIVAQPSDASKASMMAQAVTAMAVMDKSQLDQVLATMNSKNFASSIPDGTAEKNAASVAMKGAVKEDVAELFGSEELSEEFKEKTAVLFEAAVNARVGIIEEEIKEAYAAQLTEELAEAVDIIQEQVNAYLTHAANEWLKENQVAIDKSIRTQLAENLINSLSAVFAEHNIVIPEGQEDVVEQMAEEIAALESKLNEQINTNLELVSVLEDYNKDEVFDEVAEGLAVTQVEKFRTLAEGVDFENDADAFKKKLEIIKENYFGVKTKPTTLNEEVEIVESADTKIVDPVVARYHQAIARTVKK
jgi:hypothetical protein